MDDDEYYYLLLPAERSNFSRIEKFKTSEQVREFLMKNSLILYWRIIKGTLVNKDFRDMYDIHFKIHGYPKHSDRKLTKFELFKRYLLKKLGLLVISENTDDRRTSD